LPSQTPKPDSEKQTQQRVPGSAEKKVERIAILISGRGSNMRSLVEAVANNFGGQFNKATVATVISNNPDAKGLDFAKQASIPVATIDHRQFPDREAHEQALIKKIDACADWVILAGYMRILSSKFVQHYEGRLINIHPSLLPDYPGLDTHERALKARETHAGASVHYVITELDAGPVILQARVAIKKADDADQLAARVLAEEHKIYPIALRWLLQGDISLRYDDAESAYCAWQEQRMTSPFTLESLPAEQPENLKL